MPGGCWLTLLMNRIDPALFSTCFTAWVRETWPDRPGFVAMDGKTSRRSHDRGAGKAPHCTWSRPSRPRRAWCSGRKQSPTRATRPPPSRCCWSGWRRMAVSRARWSRSIPIATNATIATAVRDAGADYLLAVKANQPTLRSEIERYFDDAPAESLDSFDDIDDIDKGHGRIEERSVNVSRETGWLAGDRRFPGELRLPEATAVIRASSGSGREPA